MRDHVGRQRVARWHNFRHNTVSGVASQAASDRSNSAAAVLDRPPSAALLLLPKQRNVCGIAATTAKRTPSQ
jgi:hypothetical protein